VVVVNGIFGWGLMTDASYDKTVSLIMIGTALLSLTSNLIFIPQFGMMAASIVNLSSEIIILLAFIWVSRKRTRLLQIQNVSV
jgi:O-antigen/teichoic acid export membrane protein